MEDKRNGSKEYTEGISIKKGKFLSWLDNYWYHYKGVTIAVAFFLVVFAVCTLQMCTKEKNDLIVVYAGRDALTSEKKEDISRVLEAIMPEDYDGDGQKSAVVNSFYILSEDQIKEIKAETDENGDAPYVDNSFISSQYQEYGHYMQTGSASVLFLDPWLFESLRAGDRLAKLEDVLGYVPDGAYDEYGVRLGDTALYRDYAVMKNMHEDTVICIHLPLFAGNSSDEDYYARETAMFRALVTYGEKNEK